MSFLSGRGETVKRTAQMVQMEAAEAWGNDTYQPSEGGLDHGSSIDFSRLTEMFLPGGRRGHLDPVRRGCANLDCTSSWAKPWKNRRRPIFEGRWACGTRCLGTLIREAIRREQSGDTVTMDQTPHRHRIPLGLLMLAQGWITHPQLRRALEGQREAGAGRIGEWLQQECGLTPETITRGLSVQWNCPILSTESFAPQAMALVMPKTFVEEFELLPLRIAGKQILYLASPDRPDASVAFALEQMTDLKVESGLLEQGLFAMGRQRLLASRFVATTYETVGEAEQLASRVAAILDDQQPIASRLVRVHQYYWLRTWLETGTKASAGTVPESTEDVLDTIFTLTAKG